jgi:ketosteroid isomerase-like protein
VRPAARDGSADDALRALAERYFNALDRHDLPAVGDCFTADTFVVYLGGRWSIQGRDEVIRRLRVIEDYESTIHVPATMSFAVDGDTAAGEIFAVAHLHVEQGETALMIVRGLRYSDTYRREAGVWRVHRRHQEPLWQYQAEMVPPAVLGQPDE